MWRESGRECGADKINSNCGGRIMGEVKGVNHA